MSKLQELIKELCPDGVEFRKLGEVCEILDSKRQPIAKGKRIPGKYPYYGANGVQDYVDNYIFDGVFLLVGEDGSVINKDNSPVLNWAVGKIWVNNHAHILAEKYCCNLRYLYFILQVTNVSKIVRGMPPKINQENLINIEIPLPPLEIQNEIVRILDTFTSHTAELQAELQARKEQYEYYRNKLLTFDENDERVKWMTLGDVCFYPRQRIPVSLLHKNNYVGVDNLLPNKQGKKESNCVPSEGSCLSYTINDILIGNIRPYLKKIWISNNNGGTNGDVLIYRIREEFLNCVMPKYLYYILSSDDFFDFDNQYAKGAKMPRGDKNMNMKYSVPIPLFSEQKRIISILDKFESLVNDLSEGLPAEIAAVQEQYEYYRNKLLTFKRKS